MKDKLPKELVKEEIKQTSKQEGSASPSGSASPRSRKKRALLPFRDTSIEKLIKTNIEFEGKRFKWFKFDVPKGSSLKGLQLRFYRNTEIKKDVRDSLRELR